MSEAEAMPASTSEAEASAPAAEAGAPAAGAPESSPYADSLSSMLRPMVAKVDDSVQQALNSQAVLAQQIDRVAAELQGFLTASQIPSFSPHAQRLTPGWRSRPPHRRAPGSMPSRERW